MRTLPLKPVGKTSWRMTTVTRVKKEIKLELDTCSELSKRLSLIFSRIRELEEDLSPDAQLYRYVYIMSALVQHVRHDGVPQKEVTRLFELGIATLQLGGVDPHSPKMGVLYADLYAVMGQVLRLEGKFWEAAWTQQMSVFLSKSFSEDRKGYEALSLSMRYLRLGHASISIEALSDPGVDAIPENLKARAYVHRLKVLRLLHNYDDASLHLANSPKDLVYTEDEKQELEWEILCLKAQKTGDITELVHAVRKGKSHHTHHYLCEAFLWTRVVKTRKWLLEFPSLRTLAKNNHFKTNLKGFLAKSVALLEQLYDNRVPLHLKLFSIGKLLSELHLAEGIEIEVLILASVIRWLSRVRTRGFQALTLEQYAALSGRLTDGKTKDVLNALGDLLHKSLGNEDEFRMASNE